MKLSDLFGLGVGLRLGLMSGLGLELGGAPAVDLTAPILTNLSVYNVTDTACQIAVDTDEVGGIVYAVIVPFLQPAPSPAQIMAGTDGDGEPATWAGSTEVASLDTAAVMAMALTAGVEYAVYVVHQDAALNFSNVLSDGFMAGADALHLVPIYGQSLSLGSDPDGGPEIASFGDAAVAITGATQASPVVITAVAHGLANGEEVYISGVGGMTQLNNETFEVASATTDTVALHVVSGAEPSVTPLNGAAFGAFTSGGTVRKILRPSGHKMFNGGVRPHYDDAAAVSNINVHMLASRTASLVPLNERISKVQGAFGETLATGMAVRLGQPSAFFTTGRGAFTVENLSRTNANGFIHYSNFYGALLNGREQASSGGGRFRLGPIVWKQGEADGVGNTPKATYKARLKTLLDDLRVSASHATLGNRSGQKLISDQVGYGNLTGYSDIAVALIELQREKAGIFCLGPSYGPEYVFTNIDDVHMTAAGYRKVGEKFGLAVQAIIDGAGWKPCHIVAASRTGAVITLTVHVPEGPLVVDTSLVAAVANSGFTYTGATITGVTIAEAGLGGPGAIEIALSAAAGGTLRYAHANGTASRIGATVGPRGNIRDSAAATASYDSSPLYNWLCVDEWVIA